MLFTAFYYKYFFGYKFYLFFDTFSYIIVKEKITNYQLHHYQMTLSILISI